jgi:hypothetical protein
VTTKTKLPPERLAEEKKAAEELARDVAYHQAIVMRGTTREASSLLFRIPLAGR